jgi:effector-binding domain-containing protein
MQTDTLNITTTPEIITFPSTLFLYLEKTGPFIQKAPLAWREFWQIAGGKFAPDQIAGMAGLGRIDSTKTGDEAFIYQAGFLLQSTPNTMPAGLQLRTIPQATYARFVLTGPYSQLAAAYPAIFTIIEQEKVPVRSDDFCIERYLNDPQITPEPELVTEILIPVTIAR